MVTNGGFESGLTGWTAFASNAQNFVTGATVTPSGFNVAGPRSGSNYFLMDQFGPGYQGVYQDFTFAGNAVSAIFTYSIFNNSYSGYANNENSSFGGGGSNQYFRVDILQSGNPLSTAAGIIVHTYLDAGPGQNNPYVDYTFDVTAALNAAGAGTYSIRFAQEQTEFFQNSGVDDVQLEVVSTPEPASMVLMSTGLLGLGIVRRRRARNS